MSQPVDLFVVIDQTTGKPVMGGGSSSPAYIRCFETFISAFRSAKKISSWNGEKPKVFRYTAVEEVTK